jgi:hypothetical protein
MPDVVQKRFAAIDDDLSRRVCAEYRAMPGLQLTVAQACRLWNTDMRVGRQVLDALVDSAFLCRRGPLYVRAGYAAQSNW